MCENIYGPIVNRVPAAGMRRGGRVEKIETFGHNTKPLGRAINAG